MEQDVEEQSERVEQDPPVTTSDEEPSIQAQADVVDVEPVEPVEQETAEKQPVTRKVTKKKVIRKKVIRRVLKKDEPPPRSF
ncbi:MAG: hypothetical protein AAGI01_08940 [Myxococcota bacterium]